MERVSSLQVLESLSQTQTLVMGTLLNICDVTAIGPTASSNVLNESVDGLWRLNDSSEPKT